MKTSFLLLIPLSIFLLRCSPKKEEPPPALLEENSVVNENKNAGTTTWLINVPEKHCDYPDHQYCRRPQIEGFCSRASYFAGDTLNIFISTTPATMYTIDIYRMGYYGGKGGRLMTSVEPQQANLSQSPRLKKITW